MKTKVLLRNRDTGKYYAGPNTWIGKCDNAYDFDEVEDAVQFGRTNNLAGVEVVLRYEDPPCDLVLPVTKVW